MRYSNLHYSKRTNAPKYQQQNKLLSILWLLLAIIVLIFVISFSNLNATQLIDGFIASFFRTSIAYLIALILAIIIALLITANEIIENIFLPFFDALQSFPSFALFPILVQALKNSPEFVIILILTITIIWPILFSIIGGMKNRRKDLEEAATVFGAHGIKRLFNFTLPILLPVIITGSIVGWGEGWEFIIGAELLAQANVGIGTYLGILGKNQQGLLLAFGILILMFLLFIINKFFWLPLLYRATQYESEA